MNANHTGICRLGSTKDDTYMKFISRLNGMLSEGAIDQPNKEGKSPQVIERFEDNNLNYTALSLLQPGESRNKFYEVPHNVSSIFTGRDDISSRLRLKCLPTQPAIMQKEHNIFVLHGFGGVGKTQVCLNFAQSHRERYLHYFVDAVYLSFMPL